MAYVVLTSPTDSRSQVLKQIAEKHGLLEKVSFIDFREEEGLAIMDRFNGVNLGHIIDTETGKEVPVENFISK